MRQFTSPGGTELAADRGLAEILFDLEESGPDRVIAAVPADGDGWLDITVARFAADVRRAAKGLLSYRVGPADRVGVMGQTGYAWIVADFAIWAVGAVTVPLYPTSSESQVGHILRDSGTSCCFVETAEHGRLVRAGAPDGLRHIWPLASVTGPLAEAGSDVPDGDVVARRRQVRATDLATIVYTSGTTGAPKGCMLTHGNVFFGAVNVVETLADVLAAAAPRNPATLLILPLSHVMGRVSQVGCLWAGVRTGLLAGPNDLAGQLPRFRPTFLIVVPYALEKIRKGARAKAGNGLAGAVFRQAERTAVAAGRARRAHTRVDVRTWLLYPVFDRLVYRKLRAAFGGQLRYVVCGGATLDPSTAEFFTGVGVPVLGAYGLTEASTAVSFNAPAADRPGSAGRPLPGTTVAISEDGEVLVRGPQVSSGYWPDGQAGDTDWLETGDLGYLDADGYLYITGRLKELIITSGGKNVSPARLEDRVRLHPLVGNCMIVGEGRPFVTALVTLDRPAVLAWARRHGITLPDADVHTEPLVHTEPRLLAEVGTAVAAANELVSRAESVRAFRVLGGELTVAGGQLTPSLKLRRQVVEEENAKVIEEMYAR